MKINNPKELSYFLKHQRRKSKRSQEDVSSKIGVQQQTISAIERNSNHAKIDTLFRIISQLDLELHLNEKYPARTDESDWNEEW